MLILCSLKLNERCRLTVYIVGGDDGWSEKFTFRAIRDGTAWSPNIVVYGDMGNDNARALPLLQLDAEQGNFDMIMHVGRCQAVRAHYCLTFGVTQTEFKPTFCCIWMLNRATLT